MNITINGDVYITNYGQTLEELTKDVEFSDFDDEFDYCDDDCEFCDCGCDDEFCNINPVDLLIEDYAELLAEYGVCTDCAKEVLQGFLHDFVCTA